MGKSISDHLRRQYPNFRPGFTNDRESLPDMPAEEFIACMARTKSADEEVRLQQGMKEILEAQAKVPVLKPAKDHFRPVTVKPK